MKNKQLEAELIERMLFDTKEIPKVLQVVDQSDFSVYLNQVAVILDAWKVKKDPARELSLAGYSVAEFATGENLFVPVTQIAEELRSVVTTKKVKDILQKSAASITEKNLDTDISKIQQNLSRVIAKTSSEHSGIDAILKEFDEYQALYEEKRKQGLDLLGNSTGFSKLDSVIDGLRDGHLWVLGGYTNLGKTYASLNILTHLLQKGHRTVFYSLEMSRVDILARVLGIMTKQNGNEIAKGLVDKKIVDTALKVVQKSKFSIHSNKTEIGEILLSMYEESLKDKPSLFVVDFLQLVTVSGAKSEYETTTQAILELQQAAKEFNIPIIVLSQVSNESVKGGNEQLMGFKGSGAIAAAADLAIELVSAEENVATLKEKMFKGEPVLINWMIKKNRHGRVGTIEMEFTGKHGIFKGYEW